MFEILAQGRQDGFREILAILTDEKHGGRTEAYEFTVAFIKKELAA